MWRLFYGQQMEALGTDSERTGTRETNVRSPSGEGQHRALPLPPPPLPLVQLPRGLSEEHDLLFGLELPLEELQRRAVEAHQVLAGEGVDEVEE